MGDCIVGTLGDVTLYESDVRLLRGPHWLNDNCITFFYEYLSECCYKGQDEISFLHPNVMFLVRMFSDAKELSNALRSLRLPTRHLVLMPINDNEDEDSVGGSHWGLLVFDRKRGCFDYYDSLSQGNLKYAMQTAKKMLPQLIPNADHRSAQFPFNHVRAAQQRNSYDCGVYVLAHSEWVAREYLNAGSGNLLDVITPEFITAMRQRIVDLIYVHAKRKV